MLLGVASNGPHTNGYSLLRKLFDWLPMDACPPASTAPSARRCSSRTATTCPCSRAAVDSGRVKALAHITGGGLPENLPRVLPDGIDAHIQLGSWPVPPLFRLVREVAVGMATHELYRTLNMGVGMVVVCAADEVAAVQALDQRADVGASVQLAAAADARRPNGGPADEAPALVILASGNGSNAQAIIDACASGALPAEVMAVVSDHGDANGARPCRRRRPPRGARRSPRRRVTGRLRRPAGRHRHRLRPATGWCSPAGCASSR